MYQFVADFIKNLKMPTTAREKNILKPKPDLSNRANYLILR